VAPGFALSVAAGVIGMLTLGSRVWGQELRTTADVALQEEYQDNVFFSQTAKERTWLTTVAPRVKARYGSERASVSGGARLEGRAYSRDGDLNTVTQLYTASAERRTERLTSGVSGSFIRDTTLDTELQQTGIVLDRHRRVSRTGRVDLGYALTERTETRLIYSYTDTKYDAARLADYVDQNVQLETRHAVSDARHALGATVSASIFETDSSYRSRELSAAVSYTHHVSERFQAALTAGLRRTRVRIGGNLGATATDAGVVSEVRLTRQWDTGSLSLAVSRRTNPSGSGRLVETTHGSLHGVYAVTAQATATFDADWYGNSAVDPLGGNADSTLERIEPGVGWRVGERLTVAAAYTHLRQRTETGHASANRVMARLVYEWYRSE
jgi:hypothetical protein